MPAFRCTARAALPVLALFSLSPLTLAVAETLPAENSTLTLGAVNVTSTESGPLATSSVLSSVDILGGDILEKMPVAYSWELFRRAPGVLLTEFNQGTTSGKLSFRGFNGEGEVNAVKLLIDGIPSNTNDGNMPFIDSVFPMDIDSIEVVRGTSDPRYGLNNIAGNVNIHTRTGGNYNKARLRYGSFNTREVQLAKGIETSNWTQNYFFARQQVDGYRDHADTERYSFGGKWFYTPDDGSYRLGLIARHYESEAQEAGYLTEDDARHHPRMSNDYNATDKGTRRMNQVSVHFDTDLADTLSWSAKTYLNTFDDRRWTQYWRTSSQQERDTYEDQYGAITSLTWRPQVDWLHAFALEGGSDVQKQQNRSERYRTVQRVRQAQTRDQDFAFNTVGAYVQAEIEPLPSLKIVPAYRVDKISGDFTNKMTGQDYDINDYGLIKQPKFSASYDISESLVAYGNWGRTFQIGSGNGAYRTQAGNLSPSINEGWEAGLKWSPTAGLQTRAAVWEQTASDEVATILGVNGTVGSNEVGNVGKTRRQGWDLQANWQPDARWRAWASYSRQKATIEVPDPSAPATRGRQIENVPNWLASAGLEFSPTPDWTFSAWGNGQGDYYVERTNTLGRFGGYALLNLSATYQLNLRNQLSLQLKNATDRAYLYAWYDSGSSGYSPGDGRALYLTWTREL